MQLHELYLSSLGGDGVTMEPACTLALEASFGSIDPRFLSGGIDGWKAAGLPLIDKPGR